MHGWRYALVVIYITSAHCRSRLFREEWFQKREEAFAEFAEGEVAVDALVSSGSELADADAACRQRELSK